MIMGLFLVVACVLSVGIWIFVGRVRLSKKQRRPAIVMETKDWESVAGRLEKRIKAMEADAQSFQSQLRDKDKNADESRTALADMKRRLDQEKAGREREESLCEKGKKKERVLQEDLVRTREALNSASSDRIKLEHEVKDLRSIKEGLSVTGRGLSSRVMALERQLESALKELKELRAQNALLCKKNEGTEWVSKSDYKQIESALECVRAELEGLKEKQK